MFQLHSLHNGGFNLSGQLGKLIVNLFVLLRNPIRLRDILLLIGVDMVLLARNISKQIENELEYPGQIKVSVVRESRCVEYAK